MKQIFLYESVAVSAFLLHEQNFNIYDPNMSVSVAKLFE